MMGLGVHYRLTPTLSLASAWTVYFNTLSKQGRTSNGQKNVERYQTGWEGGLGLDYQVVDNVVLRTGFLFNRAAHTQAALTSLTWSFDHVMVGGGLTWTCADWLELTVGGAHMLANGGLNGDEYIEYLVERSAFGLELGFYFDAANF